MPFFIRSVDQEVANAIDLALDQLRRLRKLMVDTGANEVKFLEFFEIDELAQLATARPWYVGAQNDTLYIIAGRAPSPNNDTPFHDADRIVIAKVYDEKSAAFIALTANTHDALVTSLRAALKNLDGIASGDDLPSIVIRQNIREVLAKAES